MSGWVLLEPWSPCGPLPFQPPRCTVDTGALLHRCQVPCHWFLDPGRKAGKAKSQDLIHQKCDGKTGKSMTFPAPKENKKKAPFGSTNHQCLDGFFLRAWTLPGQGLRCTWPKFGNISMMFSYKLRQEMCLKFKEFDSTHLVHRCNKNSAGGSALWKCP